MKCLLLNVKFPREPSFSFPWIQIQSQKRCSVHMADNKSCYYSNIFSEYTVSYLYLVSFIYKNNKLPGNYNNHIVCLFVESYSNCNQVLSRWQHHRWCFPHFAFWTTWKHRNRRRRKKIVHGQRWKDRVEIILEKHQWCVIQVCGYTTNMSDSLKKPKNKRVIEARCRHSGKGPAVA